MKPKDGATPRPWAVRALIDDGSRHLIRGSSDGAVVGGVVVAFGLALPDADLIVRAVNSHEALVPLARNAAHGPADGESLGAFAVRIQEMGRTALRLVDAGAEED